MFVGGSAETVAKRAPSARASQQFPPRSTTGISFVVTSVSQWRRCGCCCCCCCCCFAVVVVDVVVSQHDWGFLSLHLYLNGVAVLWLLLLLLLLFCCCG